MTYPAVYYQLALQRDYDWVLCQLALDNDRRLEAMTL